METDTHNLGNLWSLLAFIAIPGVIGGLISAIWDSLTVCVEALPDPDDRKAVARHDQRRLAHHNAWFYVGRSLIGMAGAFGVVLVGLWVGKLTLGTADKDLVSLVALCLIAGLFSRKLLPIIGQRIEDEILRQRVSKSEKDAKAAIESSHEAITFSDAISFAQTALSRESTIDVRQGIEKLETIESQFPQHRTLHIYLGRLHRRLGDYDSGIQVLRKYIQHVDENAEARHTHESKCNIADAYYNIACYHSLKANHVNEQGGRQEEVERLTNEATESLRLAIDGNPENKQEAKTDPDLEFVRDKCSDLLA